MASNSLNQLAQTIIARSKTLVNNDLKKICKEEGQVQGGNKVHLQGRVIALINDATARNDSEALTRLRYRVYNHGESPQESVPSSTPSLPPHGSPPIPGLANMHNGYGSQSNGYQSQSVSSGPRSLFKESPFHQVRELLPLSISLDASPSHRQSINRGLQLSESQVARMRADPTMRLFLFSAMEQPLNNYTRLDVAFPSQIEVKINGDEVRANFKGLKNKPGSTRPADITDLVRKTAQYKNNLLITYALTQKRYNMYVYMVKKESVDDLARRIRQRNVITKQTVINEMRQKANDPDIEVGSVNLSLKDPISTLRITIPVRSTVCTHNQCFDAESFLQLQEQAPTWTCPICNKTVSFEALAVDQYVQEILESVSKNTDQVTIDPMGSWSQANNSDKKNSRTSGYGANYDNSEDDEEDDLVEIPDYRVAAIKSEAVPTPQSLAQTPPLSSREASSAPRTGQKRTSEVIDLTLSDDDEPVRPTKKVAYHTPSSLPDPSRRYQLHFGVSSAPMRPQAHSRHSLSSGLRLDPPPPPSSQNLMAYGAFPQRSDRQSYPNQGSPAYPTYLGSSP